jgi:hypothetical protein
LEVGIVFPDGPGDAGEFIGEGDGGFVVTAEAFEAKGPGLEGVRRLGTLGMQEDGACPVDEEHAEVGVAVFADAAESTDGAAGAFARGEAEEAGEVATGGESVWVADGGDECGGGEETDPGYGSEACDRGELACESGEVDLGRVDAFVELLHLVGDLGESGSESGWETRFGVVEESGEGWENVARPNGDRDPELAEETAGGVDACGSGGEPCGAKPVESGESLLIDRFDGDGADLFVPEGFEDALGVGAVGFVASDVGADGMGGRRTTACPRSWSLRPQWWADPQASRRTVAGCRSAKKGRKRERERRWCSRMWPGWSETATSKTDLA